ncbi:MAG: hypothetical protein KAV00_03245 [Phycisphaerae bacterium]|nr:hypothetical protein [Phycisphaerae bacterium]
MAKVIFSALVERMSGSHGKGGSVSSQWKGINVLKRHPAPRQPRTATQQKIRGIMNTLAGDWYALSTTLKDLWNKYASLLPNPLTGMNAYLKLNANLYRYLSSSDVITAPPPTPSTPEPCGTLTVVATDSVTNTVTWVTPTGVADYAIADFSFMAGRDDRAHPRWGYAAGASASALTMTHTHAYPVDTIMSYRVRVMDAFGRMSPFSERKDVTVA